MANLENVNIETSISDILGNAKGVTSPASSNIFNPAELDATGDYIDEQLQIAKSPGFNLKEAGLSEDAFFPGRDTPVTQQGYSGKTFSAPTIAATGGLFPYAVLNARQAEEKLAKQKLLEKGRAGKVKYADIVDLDKNILFHKGQEKMLRLNWEKSVGISKEKHGGSGAYGGVYAKPGMDKIIQESEDIAALWNESYETAIDILASPDEHTKPQVRDSRDMIEGADLISGDMTEEDWAKTVKTISETGNRLSTSHKSLSKFIEISTKDLADRTMISVNQLEGLGDADFNKVQELTHKSPYLKMDDNDEIVFDEDAAIADLQIWYDDTYKLKGEGEVLGQEPEGGFKAVSKAALSRIKHEIVPKLNIKKKDMSYRKHALAKKLATHGKELEEVEYTISDETISATTHTGENIDLAWDNGYSFPKITGKTMKVQPGKKDVYDLKTGNKIEIINILDVVPIKVGDTKFGRRGMEDKEGRFVQLEAMSDRNKSISIREEVSEDVWETKSMKPSELNLIMPLDNVKSNLTAIFKQDFTNAEKAANEERKRKETPTEEVKHPSEGKEPTGKSYKKAKYD